MSLPQQPQSPVPTPSPYAAAPVDAARNPLGVASFACGLAAVVLGAVSQIAMVGFVRAGGYQLYAVVSGALSVILLILGIAALVLGLVAAQRPGSRLRAGMGMGIGIAVCVSVLAGFAVGGIVGIL